MFVTTYVQLMKLYKHDEYELWIKKFPCVVSPIHKRMSENYLGMGRPIDKLLINKTGITIVRKLKNLYILQQSSICTHSKSYTYLILIIYAEILLIGPLGISNILFKKMHFKMSSAL